MAEKKEITFRYLEKYGNQVSKRGLAKIMYKENSEVFGNEEQARTFIRNYTGSNGSDSRIYEENDNKYFFHKGEKQIEKMVYELQKENASILILNDTHVPFHDNKAIDCAFEYGVKNNIDTIYLNGDNFDYYGESKFDKDLRQNRLESDYEKYNDFLYDLRCTFPDADIYFKVGNHELRYYKTLMRSPQLAHLLGVGHFQFEEVFCFTELGIKIIHDYQIFRVGDTNIIHGHEVRGGGMFVARWLALKFFENTICGHFHKTDHYSKVLTGEKCLDFDSIGCLCDLHPKYMPINEWNHGFGHLIKRGQNTEFYNKKIINGIIKE